MTNENLVELIQDGEAEMIPVLWEQTEKFFSLKAKKWFFKYPDMCRRAGVDLDDLMQEAYFAFTDAIRYYKREEGFTFLTYTKYPLLARFNYLLGLRYEAQSHLPLNGYVDIEKPLGDGDVKLLDAIPDPSAAAAFKSLEDRLDSEILRRDLEECIDRLKPAYAQAIRMRFFQGHTLESAAEKLGCSPNMVKSREADGLRGLRRGQNAIRLKKYRDDIIERGSRSTGFSIWERTRTSCVEYAVIRLEELEKRFL